MSWCCRLHWRSFSLLNAVESRRVHYSDIEVFVCLHAGRNSTDWNKRWQNGQYEGPFHVLLFVYFSEKWREIENCTVKKGSKIHVKSVLSILHDKYCRIFSAVLREINFNNFLLFSYFVQAGTQISLADLLFSDETCTLWYNLLPCKQIPGKKTKEQNEESMFLLSKQSLDSLDLVSNVWAITVISRKKP